MSCQSIFACSSMQIGPLVAKLGCLIADFVRATLTEGSALLLAKIQNRATEKLRTSK
jgi:hypothetical protein